MMEKMIFLAICQGLAFGSGVFFVFSGLAKGWFMPLVMGLLLAASIFVGHLVLDAP